MACLFILRTLHNLRGTKPLMSHTESENNESSQWLTEFKSMVPEDINLMVPSTYAKLNLINHCQYMTCFNTQHCGLLNCQHGTVLDTKISTIKHLISKIIETDDMVKV
ncbi:viral DNA genome packaging protein [Vombatid gammaherpesvirus 1]|uniref:Viral DNA genome packaging protein n=1 Tax=Vombatid gammaherpesvirus 1 TaxID=2052651 RepID=A0A3S8D7I6_9GAMA|nr:viral DNA genome packaging protein [Vombatid gammaherpesvirus 1]AZB49167.1 viral DNA genome packaging protein [Vombatid gammaherpesvirus 1]